MQVTEATQRPARRSGGAQLHESGALAQAHRRHASIPEDIEARLRALGVLSNPEQAALSRDFTTAARGASRASSAEQQPSNTLPEAVPALSARRSDSIAVPLPPSNGRARERGAERLHASRAASGAGGAQEAGAPQHRVSTDELHVVEAAAHGSDGQDSVHTAASADADAANAVSAGTHARRPAAMVRWSAPGSARGEGALPSGAPTTQRTGTAFDAAAEAAVAAAAAQRAVPPAVVVTVTAAPPCGASKGADGAAPPRTRSARSIAMVSSKMESAGWPAWECVVCMDPRFNGLIGLHCGHVFHGACIGRALAAQRVCPVCREPVEGARDIRRVFV